MDPESTELTNLLFKVIFIFIRLLIFNRNKKYTILVLALNMRMNMRQILCDKLTRKNLFEISMEMDEKFVIKIFFTKTTFEIKGNMSMKKP